MSHNLCGASTSNCLRFQLFEVEVNIQRYWFRSLMLVWNCQSCSLEILGLCRMLELKYTLLIFLLQYCFIFVWQGRLMALLLPSKKLVRFWSGVIHMLRPCSGVRKETENLFLYTKSAVEKAVLQFVELLSPTLTFFFIPDMASASVFVSSLTHFKRIKFSLLEGLQEFQREILIHFIFLVCDLKRKLAVCATAAWRCKN